MSVLVLQGLSSLAVTQQYDLCFIGTDATHAEHIETIKSRMYVGLTADQRFLPGELGMGLVEGMFKQTHTHAITLITKPGTNHVCV